MSSLLVVSPCTLSKEKKKYDVKKTEQEALLEQVPSGLKASTLIDYDAQNVDQLEMPSFKNLINDYKSKYFKTLPTIHHEFLYSCLNPADTDLVLCLEKNVYPENIEIHNLLEMRKKRDGTEVPIVSKEDDMKEEEIKEPVEKAGFFTGLFTKKVQDVKAQNEPEGSPSPDNQNQNQADAEERASQLKSPPPEEEEQNSKVPGAEGIQDYEEELKNKYMEFHPAKKYENFKETGTERSKYAVSSWRINKGLSSIQENEYGFEGLPVNNKFYISWTGDQVFFFLSKQRPITNEIIVYKMIVLRAKDLEYEKEFVFTYEFPQIQAQFLKDCQLINNGSESLLIVLDSSAQAYYVISMDRNLIMTSFPSTIGIKVSESSAKENEGVISGMLSVFKANDLLTARANMKILKIGFKEETKAYLYIVAVNERKKDIGLYKIKNTEQDHQKFFTNVVYMFDIPEVDLIDNVHCNRILEQFVFTCKQKIFMIQRVPLKKDKTKIAKSTVKAGTIEVQKNSFLYMDLICIQNEDELGLSIFSIHEPKNKVELTGMLHSLNEHIDVKRTADKNIVTALGKPANNDPTIAINYISNASMGKDYQDLALSQIQEISEFRCNYPHVFFCKGNIELFIQSLNFRRKMLRLQLEEEFLCFVEISQSFVFKAPRKQDMLNPIGMTEDKKSTKDNQTIGFLTKNSQEIFLNILEYNPFDYSQQFFLYKQKEKIMELKNVHGQILQAVLISASRKECPYDFALVLQYRTSVSVISVFIHDFVNPLENIQLFGQQMIYIPGSSERKGKKGKHKAKQNDSVFLIQKDAFKAKVLRLQFSRMTKEMVKVYYEFKATNINIFTMHGEKIYLMDESMQVKLLSIDNKNKKLKEGRYLELPLTVKDFWQKADFETIQMTKNTVYQRNQLTYAYNYEDVGKDYSFYNKTDFFTCGDVRSGPIKLEKANSLMYIVKDLNKSEYSGHKFSTIDETQDKYNDHDIDLRKEQQLLIGYQGIVTEQTQHSQILGGSKDKQGSQVNFPKLDISKSLFSTQVVKKDKSNKSSVDVSRIEQSKSQLLGLEVSNIEPKKDENGEEIVEHDLETEPIYDVQSNKSRIEILFTPFIDCNRIPLLYNKPHLEAEIDNSKNNFPSALRSTFIDQNEDMLVVIDNKYLAMTKNGDFLGRIKFVKNKKVIGSKSLNDSQLNEKDIKLEVIHEQQESPRKEIEGQSPSFKGVLDSDIRESERGLTKSKQHLIEVGPVDMGNTKDYDKTKDAPDFVIKKQKSTGRSQHAAINASPRLIQPAVSQEKIIRDCRHYGYSQMKWIYMSNIKNTIDGNFDDIELHDAQEKTYFLFYTESMDHVDEMDHNLVVYTLEKREGVFEFLFFKSCKLMKPKSFIENTTYFDQVKINNKGEVLQIRTEKYPEIMDLDIQPSQHSQNEKAQIDLPFEIYVDDKRIFSGIVAKFPKTLAKRAKYPQDKEDFGYVIIDDYLFVKEGNIIEYMKIFPYVNEAQLGRVSSQIVSLQIDTHGKIMRLMATQKYQLSAFNPLENNKKNHKKVYQPDLVQIIFVDNVNKMKCNMYIATWDLLKNIEYSMLQVQDVNSQSGHKFVCKGINQKLNYIVSSEYFFDVQFMVPLTFLKTTQKGDQKSIPVSINEVKLAASKSLYLGLGNMSSIATSVTMQNMLYWKEILESSLHKITPQKLHIQHYEGLYDSSTVLHMFALDHKMLKFLYDEIKKNEPEAGSDEVNRVKPIFFSLIYPNKDMESPFDIAVNNNSPKCIDIMLQMLSDVPDYSISQFVKKHFPKLFTLNLTIFETFLDSCTFNNQSMENIKSLEWKDIENEVYRDYHTCYVASDFKSKIFKSKVTEDLKNKVKENKKKLLDMSPGKKSLSDKNKRFIINELTQYDHQIHDSDENEIKDQQKRVEVTALEFDWIFYGKDSKNFLERLAETENDNLFTINSIKIIILFFWSNYFNRIFRVLLIPYIAYMVFFITYVTYVYEMRLENPDTEEEKNTYWYRVHLSFIVIILIILGYFILIEIIQIVSQRLDHFKEFWNWVDIASFALNIAFIVCDLTHQNPVTIRPLGSVAVFLMWLKLFFYLRLFQPTSNMIRLIFEVCYDIGSFTFVLILAMISWGNVFYILANNSLHVQMAAIDPDNPPEEDLVQFTGANNFLIALLYSFNMGLGNYQTPYYGLNDETLLWILFVGEALLIQVVLLNLLISIMGNTFERVHSIREQSKLKEICQMICEHEFILRRESVYKRSKYIFVIKLEQAGGSLGGGSEGPIAKMGAALQQMMEDTNKKSQMVIENLKEELIASQKGMDQKLTSNQGQGNQITQIQKDLKLLSDQVINNALSVEEMKKQNMELLKSIQEELEQLNKPEGMDSVPQENSSNDSDDDNQKKNMSFQNYFQHDK